MRIYVKTQALYKVQPPEDPPDEPIPPKPPYSDHPTNKAMICPKNIRSPHEFCHKKELPPLLSNYAQLPLLLINPRSKNCTIMPTNKLQNKMTTSE